MTYSFRYDRLITLSSMTHPKRAGYQQRLTCRPDVRARGDHLGAQLRSPDCTCPAPGRVSPRPRWCTIRTCFRRRPHRMSIPWSRMRPTIRPSCPGSWPTATAPIPRPTCGCSWSGIWSTSVATRTSALMVPGQRSVRCWAGRRAAGGQRGVRPADRRGRRPGAARCPHPPGRQPSETRRGQAPRLARPRCGVHRRHRPRPQPQRRLPPPWRPAGDGVSRQLRPAAALARHPG